MQHHRLALSPPPDVVPQRAPSAPPRLPLPAPPAPEFLVIGLFALRLAKRLIETLENYPGRDDDIAWLANFLAPFHPEYALAKVSGPRKDDYVATYQGIVSRMIQQPRFPIRFMQMNPDRSLQREHRRTGVDRSGDMTDAERLDMIDFSDAAGEWDSIVPIPAREANRMIELADQRRIADLDERRPLRDGMPSLRDEEQPQRDGRQPSQEDRYYFEERRR